MQLHKSEEEIFDEIIEKVSNKEEFKDLDKNMLRDFFYSFYDKTAKLCSSNNLPTVLVPGMFTIKPSFDKVQGKINSIKSSLDSSVIFKEETVKRKLKNIKELTDSLEHVRKLKKNYNKKN